MNAAAAPDPAARLVARLRALPLEWEEHARTFARPPPDAAALVQYDRHTEGPA
jgi:hypothetical protein